MGFCKARRGAVLLRKFSDRPVEEEKLSAILETGRNAPTAHNFQPQRIFVLRSPEALEKVDGCTGALFHPPVMIVVAYDPAVSWKRETDGKDHGEIDARHRRHPDDAPGRGPGLGTTYVGMFEPEKLHAAFPEMAGPGPNRPAASGLPGGGRPSRPPPRRPASPWRSW